jgi:hypothetical protein
MHTNNNFKRRLVRFVRWLFKKKINNIPYKSLNHLIYKNSPLKNSLANTTIFIQKTKHLLYSSQSNTKIKTRLDCKYIGLENSSPHVRKRMKDIFLQARTIKIWRMGYLHSKSILSAKTYFNVSKYILEYTA